MADETKAISPWQLRSDIAWARCLLWFARSGTGGREPKRGVHRFMADRYGRLSDYYFGRGERLKAKRLALKSEWHYRAAGPDEPPRAVAVAMRVPGVRAPDLVSKQLTGEDDIA